MHRTLIAMLLALVPVTAIADPAAAIAKARDLIQRRDFNAAVAILKSAKSDAESIAKPSERAAALSAIHFYKALALSEWGKTDDAAAELREFFRYRPQSTVDASRYPRNFVDVFERVRRDTQAAQTNRGAFYDQYPGFEFVDAVENPPDRLWGSTSAFQILATDEEKDAWAQTRDDESRARFVNDFWSRRDPDPSTPANELRTEMLRRVAFADRIFGDESTDRGSLTDRGQVYVLLGPPYRVKIRPLNEVEAAFAPRRRGAGEGAAEEWVYRREQLPGKIPTHEVEFRFVANTGHVTRELQRTFPATNALGSARAALRGQ
jgi:GWxTD domain-containing protein